MGNKDEAVHDDSSKGCVHHWLIDEKNFGICKKCGARKEFYGSWSATSLQKAWSSRSGKAQPDVSGTKS